MNYEAIQLELEDGMVSAGAERYAKELDRGVSHTGPGKALIRRALKPMAEAIEEARRPKVGRPARGLPFIANIDAFVLADITMRRVIDCAAKEETLIKTCKAVAKAVEWHHKDASLNEASKAIWNKTQERLRKTQNPEFRRASIDGTVAGMRKWAEENAREDWIETLRDVRAIEWSIHDQLDVGGMLISLFAASTQLITTQTVTKGKRDRKTFVRFTEGTQEWLEKQHEYHSLLRPVHLPMVVPPTNWSGMTEGGYVDNSKAGVRFIKTKARSMDVESLNLTDIYDSVNLIQSTPWRVNLSLYRVMSQTWETGSGIGDVPPRRFEDGVHMIPALNSRQQDMTPEERKQDKACKALMIRRRAAHEFNADLKADIKSFGDLLSVATRFAQYPAFYHPHKLDWRQRAYPVSIFLNPQGDQFNKALIEFTEGKRMGDSENSAAWLAIHGANCYGVDKVSFDERIAWVEENEGLILESALFPFDCKFWQDADGGAKAWPFLAFCFEWLAYKISGDDHVTHLPVALDGSNSGLQHLSAMLRDPDGARITCVAPGEAPEDVYQMIADEVEAQLCLETDQLAAIWRGKVSRKICKQPTMTYTYSATESGMRDQIANALGQLDSSEGSYLTFTDPLQTNQQAADYLAPIVRQAIACRMAKAAEAMEFLQACARVYSQTGLPLRWTTPLGVPVVQYYPTSTSQRKEVFINGQMHKLKVNVDSPDRLDKKKSSAGVSPNFVHSMDSSHLLWTTLFANDECGIEDFAMIHDSFGTHATACDELAYGLREMFVALYDEDRLRSFWMQTVSLLGPTYPELIDELPCVPDYGSFEIETVRESEYFFA